MMYTSIIVVVAIWWHPLISHAFFPDELRALHEQSREERETKREQFKQDVVEKRKEFLTKWGDRKEKIKDQFKNNQQKIKSELRANRSTEAIEISTSTVEHIRDEEYEKIGFIFAIKKSVVEVLRTFFPIRNVLGN